MNLVLAKPYKYNKIKISFTRCKYIFYSKKQYPKKKIKSQTKCRQPTRRASPPWPSNEPVATAQTSATLGCRRRVLRTHDRSLFPAHRKLEPSWPRKRKQRPRDVTASDSFPSRVIRPEPPINRHRLQLHAARGFLPQIPPPPQNPLLFGERDGNPSSPAASGKDSASASASASGPATPAEVDRPPARARPPPPRHRLDSAPSSTPPASRVPTPGRPPSSGLGTHSRGVRLLPPRRRRDTPAADRRDSPRRSIRSVTLYLCVLFVYFDIWGKKSQPLSPKEKK